MFAFNSVACFCEQLATSRSEIFIDVVFCGSRGTIEVLQDMALKKMLSRMLWRVKCTKRKRGGAFLFAIDFGRGRNEADAMSCDEISGSDRVL